MPEALAGNQFKEQPSSPYRFYNVNIYNHPAFDKPNNQHGKTGYIGTSLIRQFGFIILKLTITKRKDGIEYGILHFKLSIDLSFSSMRNRHLPV
jgi:hypothetical protein